ncbi:MAG: thiol-disulfide isomerase [Acidobacteriota bacterium]|nr:thiol-disulfide isomerase [Acidobacteriota bacterium]
MPLVTYAETKPRANSIAKSVQKKSMPPWFADPRFGHFSNNPSLTRSQIDTFIAWAAAGAPAGNPAGAPPPRHWITGWRIPQPDKIFKMPVPVNIPAQGVVEYTYEIVPTGFKKNEWVQMAELRPSDWRLVHHAVVYIRPPNSKWLQHAPIGVPFTASSLKDPQDRRDARWTDSDLLLVYAPGSPPDQWSDGLAKFIPRGSDLVFQIHYMPNGHPTSDQTSVGLVFAKRPPRQRVITLQLTNSSFLIPPEASNFPVEAWGTLPNDATLLDIFPHMHLRGKKFEFDIVHKNGKVQTLLRVSYDFHWQLHYELAKPMKLKAGTKLQAIAWYDNSWNNPNNPDPNAGVRWGDYDFDEMMVGFFDIAVAPNKNKFQFFKREAKP